MALKILMRRKELSEAQAELAKLREKQEGFAKREEELANDINEASTDEEKAVVEEAVEEFEKEQAETDEAIRSLEEKVEGIEKEMEEIEAAQEPANDPEPEETPAEPEQRERNVINMNKRNVFHGMDVQTRAAMFDREDVQSFLGTVRESIKNKRAIEGGGLLVPEVFLGLIRENIEEYSKLYKHVYLRQISGTGRAVVMGTIPEAVWTDCCGNINDLSLTFNDAEVACWKVGGYFDVCNATVEDSDIDLASELLTVLGQSIGYALDKAILFGLGTRMPLGVFTRLAQTAAPSDYPATARAWKDLHTSNIATIDADATGADFFKAVLKASAAAKGKYSRGEKVWAMNEATYTALKVEGLTINAAGAIVSGVEGTMPVAGGVVEVLEFIPDNVIIGGYFDLYLLAERAGTRLDSSEHAMFLQDRTVYRGTARYDGMPVIAEGFVAIGINGTAPSASGISFAPDEANTPDSDGE